MENTKALREKLGLTPDMSAHFSHAPAEFFDLLGFRPRRMTPDEDGTYDYIQAFFTEREQLEASSGILTSKLADDGMLWISWPKQTSGMQTDISEQDLRNVLLPIGVVDTKVCAIDETWSALKFVWRKA